MNKLMALGWLATAALSIAMAGCSTADPAAASAVDDSEVRPANGGAASGARGAPQPAAREEPIVVARPTGVTVTIAASTITDDQYVIEAVLTVAEDIGVSGVEVSSIARNGVEILSVDLGSVLGDDLVKGPRYIAFGGLSATTAYARVGESPKEPITGVVATFVVSAPDGQPTGDDFATSVTFTDANFTMQPPLATTLAVSQDAG